MKFNYTELKNKLFSSGYSMQTTAEQLKMKKSTLESILESGKPLKMLEITTLVNLLGLNENEAQSVFFALHNLTANKTN